MNLSDNILNTIFNTHYWQDYREYNKLRNVLLSFFNGEDTELQKAFITNFDYPTNMTESPVRFEKSSGDIYYTLNFKSQELFENSGTKEKATSNSLAALDRHLPLGVTQYLEPQPVIHIPDTFTLLCVLKLQTDVTPKRNIYNLIGSILKPLIILTIIGASIKYLVV
tara:strand:- start:3014 stop:3514 length:501 start_codon:yes stop_codon:yes gene_type:complete